MQRLNSYYFAASINRLMLFSRGKSITEIDRLAVAHIKDQQPQTILGVAKIFMGGINDRDFGQNIKNIMAGGMIERLKIEATSLVSTKKGEQ